MNRPRQASLASRIERQLARPRLDVVLDHHLQAEGGMPEHGTQQQHASARRSRARAASR